MSNYNLNPAVPLEEIYLDEELNKGRGKIDPYTVVELANQIKNSGLQSPIHIQPWEGKPGYKYRILAGHRRYTAVQVNGDKTIAAFIVPITDDFEARTFNIVENLARLNLTFDQEAEALVPFFRKGWNDTTVAKHLGKTPGWVEPRRKLLQLPEVVKEEVKKGNVTQNHIKALWSLRDNPEKLIEQLRSIREQKARGERFVEVKKDVGILDLLKNTRPSAAEINDLLTWMFHNIVTPSGKENFAARTLALVMGNINRAEFWRSAKAECERLDLPFNPPEDVAKILYKKVA